MGLLSKLFSRRSLVREGGAAAVELHTGAYAEASLVADMDIQNAELKRIKQIVATA